jgi:hypothetical protein
MAALTSKALHAALAADWEVATRSHAFLRDVNAGGITPTRFNTWLAQVRAQRAALGAARSSTAANPVEACGAAPGLHIPKVPRARRAAGGRWWPLPGTDPARGTCTLPLSHIAPVARLAPASRGRQDYLYARCFSRLLGAMIAGCPEDDLDTLIGGMAAIDIEVCVLCRSRASGVALPRSARFNHKLVAISTA